MARSRLALPTSGKAVIFQPPPPKKKYHPEVPTGILTQRLWHTLLNVPCCSPFVSLPVACSVITGMHHMFGSLLPKYVFTERPGCKYADPWDEQYAADLEAQFAEHHSDLAAVILEPVVQGAGGMWMYSPEYMRRVRQLCDQYRVLLIYDEIATGFGRTGELFACHHAGHAPDIMCLGKALTGVPPPVTITVSLSNKLQPFTTLYIPLQSSTTLYYRGRYGVRCTRCAVFWVVRLTLFP